jgi:glycosyltransferase involved in cell wall biosynthesis
MNKILLVDAQVFQTPAWHRGMGKYSYELIKELAGVVQNGTHWDGIELIFTNNMPVNKEVLKKINEIKNIETVELSLKTNEFDNRPVALNNQKVLDEYIENRYGLIEIDYLVCSIMQSEIAPAFSKLKNVNNAVIFYDLIPLMYHDTYLQDPLSRKGYLSKLAELLKSDKFLAISKTVANDLSLYLGVDSSRITSIDGGPIAHSKNEKKYKIDSPYILMPTGDDLRKNNKRAVEGFSIFNKSQGNIYKLVITSHFTEAEKDQLRNICEETVFTGNISGEELNYLYENTDALLFPSEYEGLGMPILEALEKFKPIACSDISVFREMSTSLFNTFHPEDIMGISKSLEDAVKLDMKKSSREIKDILTKYSWLNTAQKTSEAFKSISKVAPVKKSLTVLAPSSQGSLLGSYIQKKHSEMSRQFTNIHYSVENIPKRQPEKYQTVSYLNNVENLEDYGQDVEKELIFHIDNKHITNLLTALARRGVIYLYETNLELAWNNMLEKDLISESRLNAEKTLNDKYCTDESSYIISLLYRHDEVRVVSIKDFEILQKILKKAKLEIKLTYEPFNVTKLPYVELLRNKEIILYITNSGIINKSHMSNLPNQVNIKIISTSDCKNEFEFVDSLCRATAVLVDRDSISKSDARLIEVLAKQADCKKIYQIINNNKPATDGIKSIGTDELFEFVVELNKNNLAKDF